MTSLRCLRLAPFLLLTAIAGAACTAGGSGSGELPGSIGNGKTDGFGVEDGSELQTAALTLINYASRRTLVTEVGLTDGVAAAVEAARPVPTLAALENNDAVGTPAAEGLVEFAATHLATGGLPPCVPGTVAATQESVATGAWEACNIEVASPVVIPQDKSLVIYPGATVRLEALRAATNEMSSIKLQNGATLAIIGGQALPVIFASGTDIEIVGGASGSHIRLRHVLFAGDLFAGRLREDILPEDEGPVFGPEEDADGGVDGGDDGPVTEPVYDPAPATTDIEFSYVGALQTAGQLTPIELANGEAFRATQRVNIRHSVINWTAFDSTSFSGIKCDAPAGESIIGPALILDHALVNDNLTSVQLSARDSVFEGATVVFGSLTGNHIIGDIIGAAWGDLIVKVVAQNNAWSDWSDTETANPTGSTGQSCGSDASEVDVESVLTEIPAGVGPDVSLLSAPVITVAGLTAEGEIE